MKIFKNPVFRTYFFASLIDTLGEGIFSLACIVLIAKYSGSVMDIGYMLVLTMLPSVFLAPFIGAILDRFNKAKVAFYFNIIRFLMILIVPICLLLDVFTIKILYLSILISYIAWYVVVPAQEAMLKEAIDEDQYVSGVSYTQAAWQVGLLSSALLAGFLMKYTGMSSTLLVSSGMFLVSCLLFWRIAKLHQFSGKAASGEESTTAKQYFQEIKEGWAYLYRNKAGLYFSLASCITIPFFSVMNILIAPFNYQILQGDEMTLGMIDCMAGVGSLLSVAFCLRVAAKKVPALLNVSMVLLGVAFAVFALTDTFSGAYAMYALIGLFIGNVKVLSKTLVFEYIETEYVGRTMTTISMISLALAIVFSLASGALGEQGLVLAYVVTASTLLAPIVLTLLGMKHARKSRVPVLNQESTSL